MKKKMFDQLVQSIQEMKKIRAGKLSPPRVTKFDPILVKEIRHRLKQSQTEFAYMIGVSVSTLRNWEQGLRHPEGPARVLLKVVEKNPQAVLEALHF